MVRVLAAPPVYHLHEAEVARRSQPEVLSLVVLRRVRQLRTAYARQVVRPRLRILRQRVGPYERRHTHFLPMRIVRIEQLGHGETCARACGTSPNGLRGDCHRSGGIRNRKPSALGFLDGKHRRLATVRIRIATARCVAPRPRIVHARARILPRHARDLAEVVGAVCLDHDGLIHGERDLTNRGRGRARRRRARDHGRKETPRDESYCRGIHVHGRFPHTTTVFKERVR